MLEGKGCMNGVHSIRTLTGICVNCGMVEGKEPAKEWREDLRIRFNKYKSAHGSLDGTILTFVVQEIEQALARGREEGKLSVQTHYNEALEIGRRDGKAARDGELRERLSDYFAGLIAIPDPQATLQKLSDYLFKDIK